MFLWRLLVEDCFSMEANAGSFQRKLVSAINRQRRLGVCRRKLHLPVHNQWYSVIFSVETRTKIVYGQDHKVCVWRRSDDSDERIRPDWVSTITGKQIAVHQWCSGVYFLLWYGYTVSCWGKYEHWKIYFSIRWQSLACYCWTFFKSCFDQSQKIKNDINIISWQAEPRSQHYRKCLENAQTKCTKTFKWNRNFNVLKRGVLDIWSAHPLH